MASKLKKADVITLGKPFGAAGIPGRSGPMQFLTEVQTIADKLPEGSAIELNAEVLSEHTVRKYLSILAEKNPSYKQFLVRTAGGTSAAGRRRLFLARLGNASIVAGNGHQGSDEGPKP